MNVARVAERDNVRLAAFLLAVFAVALISRFWALTSWSLWGDEQYSWYAANLSLHDMWFWTANDLHPPLYYASMHAWVGGFGNSTESLRAPSAFVSAATVPIAAYAALRIGGFSVAAITALLLVLNPAHLQFGQEARMYPLAGLFAIVSVIALARLLERPSLLNWLVYTASVVALLYTHYVGFVAVGIQAGILAYYGVREITRDHRRNIAIAGCAAMIAASASYVPWWRYLFDSAHRGAIDVHPLTWTNAVFDLRDAFGLERGEVTWPVIIVVLTTFGIWGLWKRRHNTMAVSVLGLALVPFGEIAISLAANPVFDLKRVSPFIPAISIVSSIALIDVGELATKALRVPRNNALAFAMLPTAIIATFMSLGVRDKYTSAGPADWRGTTALLSRKDEPIYVWPAYNVQMLRYFTGDNADLRFTDRRDFLASTDGFVPLPRTWPDNHATLVFEFTRPQDAKLRPELNSLLAKYFVVKSTQTLPRALEVSSFEARSVTQYNVDLVGPDTNWTASNDGWLTATASGSHFRLRAPIDVNGDGGVDAAFTIHIEYQDDAAVNVIGSRRDGTATTLAAAEGTTSDGWKTSDVRIDMGLPLVNDFTVSGAREIRTIEVRRYETKGATATRRGSDVTGDWFVRPDGYLEPIIPSACLSPAAGMPEEMNLTLSYLSGFTWAETTTPVRTVDGRVCSSAIAERMIVRSVILEPR